MDELQKLTGWTGDRVLYFGDHPYADLADLSLNHGWRTGAIIKEVFIYFLNFFFLGRCVGTLLWIGT